jgi:signal peptidase II
MSISARTLGLGVAILVAALDQLTKWLTFSWLAEIGGYFEVTSFLNLVTVWNRGISFGIFGDAPPPPLLLAGFAAAVAVGLAIWLWRADNHWLTTGIGFVIGGAVGNIVDRLGPAGAVADFIDLHWRNFHWPAFNVADSAITVGVCMLLIDTLPIRRGKAR